MAKLNSDYELLMIFSTKDGDSVAEDLKENFKTFIESNATITEEEDWGRRRLAYIIDYQTEGYYYLVRFNSSPEFPKDLEYRFKITDGVLRFMIIDDTEYKAKRDLASKKAKRISEIEAAAKIAAEAARVAAEAVEKAKADAEAEKAAAAELEKAVEVVETETTEVVEAETAEVVEIVEVDEIIETVEDDKE